MANGHILGPWSNSLLQDLVSGVPYKVNIYAIVEDSGIPVESKELHDKVSRLPPSASLLDINPAGPVESKPLHEKVKLLLIFGQGCTGFKTLLKHYHATDSKVKIRPNHN